MPTPDTTLHERWCRHRDADALAELVRRHSSMVFSTCMRVLRNASAAEEAAQECFIELFKVTSPIRPSVGGWLHLVAARRALDHLKMEGRRKNREADYAIHAPKSITPHWDDVSAHIDVAIANLDEETRLPVVLRFLDGKSHPEIARELGISVATVKRRVSQGVHRIREDLRGKGITVTAIALAAMLEEVPALPLPNAVVAELGKLGISGSTAWTGATGATALKSAATIGGLIAVKKVAVVVIVIAGAILVQQRYFNAGPATPPLSPEAPAAPIAAPAPIQAAVTEAPPKATFAADAGPSITGVVLDHEDKPVEGATTFLWRVGAERPDPYVNTETSADGSFTFRNVAPSKQVAVMAKKDGMAYRASRHAIYVLTESGLSGIVVRLDPAAIVEGRVVDESGRPVADKEVTARYHSPEPSSTLESCVTDSAGRFRFPSLLPGAHSLSVTPEHQFRDALIDAEVTVKEGETRSGIEIVYADDNLEVAGRIVDESGAPVKSAFVQMTGVYGPKPADDYTDKDGRFRLMRIPEGMYSMTVSHRDYKPGFAGATAGGEHLEIVLTKIERATIHGRVVDADTGEPIKKFDLQVTQWAMAELEQANFGFFKSFEDENGAFEWKDVELARLTVVARALGHEMKYEQVDLTRGATGEVTIRLKPSAIVKGIVVTSSGAPVPGAYLLLGTLPHYMIYNGGESTLPNWLERGNVARSAEDGTFVIDSLTPELRVITAFHPEFGFGTVAASKGIVSEEPLRIVVNLGGVVEGTVTLAGSPVQHAMVSISSLGPFGENDQGQATTDEQGAYRMQGVPAGTWSVAATLPRDKASPVGYIDGRRIERDGIVVADGQSTTLDFDASAGDITLEGNILLDGQPVANGEVVLRLDDATGADSNLVRADHEGRYRFENLSPGDVTILARGGSGELTSRSRIRVATLEAGQSHEIDFELAGGVTLLGTVRGLRLNENDVKIFVVEGAASREETSLYYLHRRMVASTTGQLFGYYTVEGLEPGTYTLMIMASVVDDAGTTLWTRNADVVVNVEGADGDVIQLDPAME